MGCFFELLVGGLLNSFLFDHHHQGILLRVTFCVALAKSLTGTMENHGERAGVAPRHDKYPRNAEWVHEEEESLAWRVRSPSWQPLSANVAENTGDAYIRT